MTEMEPGTPGLVFQPADLTAFQKGGLLWAVNQFVLWPLGLALTMTVDFDDEGNVRGPIELREWVCDDGHLETIEDSSDQPDFDRYKAFLATVEDRLARMPEDEARAARYRLSLLSVDGMVSVLDARPEAQFVTE